MESLQTLEVEVIVGGHNRCSGSLWSLRVAVDIHGHGRCSGWEQQAGRAWMEKNTMHLAQAVTSRSVSDCPSIVVQGRLFRGRDSGLQQAGCTTMQDGPAACQVTMKLTERDRNSSSQPASVVTHTAHSCPLSRPRSLGAVPDPWK